MGIRITPHSWRSPLLLIDSWLPAPVWQSPRLRPLEASRAHAIAPRQPADASPHAPSPLPPLLQRFARAGWLSRPGSAAAPTRAPAAVSTAAASRPPMLRMVRPAPQRPGHRTRATLKSDGRLVIAGPIGDVCAELDRLVALESSRPLPGAQR